MAGRINVAEAPEQNFGILGAPSPAPVDFSRLSMLGQTPLPSPAMGNTQTSTPQTSNFGTLQVVGELGELANKTSGALIESPGRIGGALLGMIPGGKREIGNTGITFDPQEARKFSESPIQGYTKQVESAVSGLPKPLVGPVAFLAGTIGDPGNLVGGGEAKAAQALTSEGARAFVKGNFEKLIPEYLSAIKTHYEGADNVLSADVAKSILPGWKGELAPVYHEASSDLVKTLYPQWLAEKKGTGNNTVLFTGGATGVGKSSGLKATGTSIKDFPIVYDTNLTGSSAKTKIQQALDEGYKVKIIFTQRDPVESFAQGVLPRVQKENRIIDISEHESRHTEAFPSIEDIRNTFGDQVEIVGVDNTLGKGNAKLTNNIDELPKFGYNDLHERLLAELDKAEHAGTVTREQAAAIRGEQELGAAVRGRIEPQRSEGLGTNGTETGKTAVGKTETPSQLPGQLSPQPLSRAGIKLPEFSSYKKDVTAFANEKLNVENLNISPEGKAIVTRVVEEVKPKIQEKVGKVLSNSEALNLADNTSKVLKRVVGRENTLDWQAAMLNARRSLAAAAETGRVDQAFIDNLMAIKTQGSDIARKLQSLSIGADPKEVTTAQALIEAVLDAGHNVDEVLKASKGVDFNDLNQATNFYRQFIKPKASEWLDLLRYNSMLSSPKTHIVNAIANLVNTTLVVPIEKALTGGLDFLGSKMTGAARTAYAGEGGAYLKNYLANVKEATFRFADVMTGKRAMTNLDTRDIPIANSGVKGAVAKTLGYPMRLLEGMDQFFTALAEGGEKGALNYRKSKGVKVGNIESKAERSAAYRVFRQELFDEDQGVVLDGIDQLTNLLQQARTSKNPIVSTVAKFTVPFLRTPMNIFKQGMEYSPVGFTTMLGAKNKTEQLSKAIIGSAIFAGAATMVASNRITWGEPIDPTLKAAFRAGGMQAYSVKVGNTWVSYQKLPPGLAFPLAMVAAIHDAQQNKKIDDNTVDMILGGIAKYGEFLADQSYAKSIGDLLASAKGGEAGIAKVVSNYGQQLVPYRALGGWLARLTDETQRKVDTSAGFIDQQVQLLMMNIPGLSDNVPAREDAQGNPIPQQHRFANAFSPVSFTTENESAGEFQKLMDIKEVNKKATFDTAQVKEQAQTEFEKIKSLGSSEEKKAYLKQIAAENPELAEKIIAVAKADQKTGNLEASEQRLLDSPIATRAQFIVDELNKLQTPEEKKALLKNYAQKKILTEDTLKKVAQILGK